MEVVLSARRGKKSGKFVRESARKFRSLGFYSSTQYPMPCMPLPKKPAKSRPPQAIASPQWEPIMFVEGVFCFFLRHSRTLRTIEKSNGGIMNEILMRYLFGISIEKHPGGGGLETVLMLILVAVHGRFVKNSRLSR